nr:putative reverse transcriptase domain-containing protein [Tanacetum cinerariifolium]
MDYCQSREVHTSTLVTQMEALRRKVSTLQRQHIEHAQRDVAPEDGDNCTTPITTPSTTTTSVTNAQLQAMIDEGVNAALAARDATRNGDDSHTLGTDDALTWWNSHVKTTTPEAAYAMTWATLKKKMTGKYCLRGEIKKIKTEMCVKVSRSKTMQEVIEFTTELMEDKTRAYAER